MWIKKKDIEQLSEFVKGYSSGEELDIRVNKEGSFNILKNDIYALVNTKNEQIKAVETERDSLSDYMADISHQLKTPITSMIIMADLLEEAEPEKQAEFIHNIQVSLKKMEWLVGSLLKMAKLDAHAIDFIKNKTDEYDVVLIDTAGRLQTKVNLMAELAKMRRVVGKEIPGAPHNVWMVLDANTGQNGMSQATLFNGVTDLTGIILTKMDGTSKGGIVIAIKNVLGIPVRFITLGETADDIKPFDFDLYLYSIIGDGDVR